MENKSNEQSLSELSDTYNQQLKALSKTSEHILAVLRNHYTETRLGTFKSFEDFLEDINFICEQGGTGKLIFIKEIEPKFTTV